MTKSITEAADGYAVRMDSLWGPRQKAYRDGFIAGAEWQAQQYTILSVTHGGKLVRVSRDDLVSLLEDRDRLNTLLQPGAAIPVRCVPRMVGVSVVMTKETWDGHCRHVDELGAELEKAQALSRTHKANCNHYKEQVGKLESQVERLRTEKANMQGAADKLMAERDDWHHAYDKLVSDVVHGREFAKAMDETDVLKQACDTEATGGFTATGEAEKRQPSVLERLWRIEDVLFSE